MNGNRLSQSLVSAAASEVFLGALSPIFGAAGFQTLIRYMEIVALYSLFMSVASKEQRGTDFTILACAQPIIYFAGSMILGKIADSVGYGALFSLATLLSFIAVVATVKILNSRKLEVPLNR